MNDSTPSAGPAVHYDGRKFPVGALSPDEFENFVFACLLCIQDLLGLRVIGKPSGSGDGGFDVQAEVIGSKRLACVQCKRQAEPLGTPQLTEELAKVAATAAIEGSEIEEHRFICTGGVRKKLVNQLREPSRRQLAQEAGDRLASATEGELANLRVRLEQDGLDPRQVAERYVYGLDRLTAWSLDEFDAALSPRWSDVLEVAGRYFRIATVVREHPRASFDRSAYIAEHSGFRVVVEPRLADSDLPEGVTAVSATNPLATPPVARQSINALYQLVDLAAGELVVLVGDGGVGKSTALRLLRAESLRTSADSTLSIMIALANYVPGELDRAIHQELGVVHGTWRSLPDHVLLLCDGLNECPSANVGAFLDELKSLLKRNTVACVLSTRASTRHRNVVLPQPPVACVKVEAITPIAIRRIAEHELQSQTADEFVKTYRSLADRSGSRLLWTPFAVMVGIGLWRLNAALPKTLGEMLEALLRARCARNAESAQQSPGTDVILRLAGALAFEFLVVDRRLECPAIEAGKSVREARRRCADALGIVDMTESDVVELLARHELLSIPDGRQLSFGHQLLAGALAAPVLSGMWQDHAGSLGEPIADDAWVFAARLVPRERVAEFLEAIFNTDLMLGARTARELPGEFRVVAERLLERSIAPASPETVYVQGLFGLARLGSPGAVARLRQLVAGTSTRTSHAARCALAASGDVDYLRNLLPQVDLMCSGPFEASGGDVSIWENAPFPTRLDLARHRLSECSPGDPVSESLSLVAYERDEDDAIIVERHLQAATSLAGWRAGIHALHEISPTRAKAFVEAALLDTPAPGTKACIMHVAASIGVEIDLRAAFECAVVELAPEESSNQAVYDLGQLISKVVAKSTLPADLIAVVERELPTSVGQRRSHLWQIATGCESLVIAEYAASCIEAWNADRGQACNFFIEQTGLASARGEQLVELCEIGFANEQTWYEWETWRALELVGQLGFSAKAVHLLSAMVQRLARVQRALDGDCVLSLSRDDAAVLKSENPEHARYALARHISILIPSIARVRRLLPESVLLSLLYFDTHTSKLGERMLEALSEVSDASIDETLSAVSEPWTRLSGLLIACARGATKFRVDLLASELRRTYTHPAAVHLVQKGIEGCWCKAVCEMLAKTVAELPSWSEHDSQFFWDFARRIAGRVSTDDHAAIAAQFSVARTAVARRMLELWRDHASGTRVGLLWLSAEDPDKSETS